MRVATPKADRVTPHIRTSRFGIALAPALKTYTSGDLLVEPDYQSSPMDLVEIYSASLGAMCALLIGWNIAAATVALQHRFQSILHAHLMQNIAKRVRGSGDYTVSVVLQIVILITANAVLSTIFVSNLDDLGVRLGIIALVNVMPLFLGGRTSLIADKVFGVSLPWYNMIHNWIGRICMMQALVHGLLRLSGMSGSARYDQIVVCYLRHSLPQWLTEQ